ncbi:MAG: acylphosphatase [Candidatus Micrarchaeia archaeon]
MKAHYIVRGVVQGVGYRAFVMGLAKQYGISGFVRNLTDGSVEIIAVASSEVLAQFKKELAAYSEGGASVDNIEETDYNAEQNDAEFDGFRIR